MNDTYAEAVALVTQREESRRNDEIAHHDDAISEAVALIEHRHQITRDSAALSASLRRNQAANNAAYDEAVLEFRQACDALTPIEAELKRLDDTVGASRAERADAEKVLAHHALRPNDGEFSLSSEVEAWQKEHGKIENRVRSLAARIIAETRKYDDVLHQKWELESLKERARQKVLRSRDNL